MPHLFRLLLLCWSLLAPLALAGQWVSSSWRQVVVRDTLVVPPLVLFDQFTREQGLPAGAVRGVFHDRRGYLWASVFGYGAVRYDGQACRIFRPEPGTPGAFPANSFGHAGEDSRGQLWMGTEKGLVHYDPATERFRLIVHPGIPTNYVNHLMVAADDRVWVDYSQVGCQIYDPQTGVFQPVEVRTAVNGLTGQRQRLPEKLALTAPFLSRKGNIWVNTWLGNVALLLRYQPDTDTWTFFPTPRLPLGRSTGELKFVSDDESYVWASNWQSHLWQLDVQKGAWTQFNCAAAGLDSTFTSFAPDGQDGLWCTTSNGFTCRLDLKTHALAKYRHQSGNPHSPLALSQMLGVARDSEGNLWWPTEDGVFSLNPGRQWVRRHYPPQWVPAKRTESYEALYFDTLSGCSFASRMLTNDRWQVVKMDPKGQISTVEFNNPGPIRLIRRRGNQLLIGHQGITLLDPLNLRSQRLCLPVRNRPGLTTDSLFFQKKAAQLPNGDLLLPTNIGEILYLNARSNVCDLLSVQPRHRAFSNSFELSVLQEDRFGDVWAATSQGLVKVHFSSTGPETPVFSTTYVPLVPPDSLPDEMNWANWLDFGNGDTLWVAGNFGLFYWSPGATVCRPVPAVQGQGFRLFCDRQGRVWFKTGAGIGRFTPSTSRFEIFDDRTGLDGELYDRLYRADNGEFFYHGAYRWLPDDLQAHSRPPEVVLTSFKVFERDFPLDSSLNYQHSIRLRAAQNFFSIGFAALSFYRADQNEYAYQLVGVDTGWVYAGTRNVASYTNLAPGTYQFRVKAANSDGLWNERPHVLHIFIAPEWYQTWWFRLALAALAIGLGWFFFQARLKEVALTANLQREQAERERAELTLREREADFKRRLAETEMAALRAQMNPHFIFNCLNSIKLYTEEHDTETASFYLTRFSRLIRRVLENSRSETVTLENELDALDLYLQMEAMRFKGKVQYRIEVADDVEVQLLQIPPLLVQPFVENAIWHGLMHKLEGGSVVVRVQMEGSTLLRIDIEDDGVGRAHAAELRSRSALHQKSLGMQVTSERIEAIHQLYGIRAEVHIYDLFDPAGHPNGTRVVLQIPV